MQTEKICSKQGDLEVNIQKRGKRNTDPAFSDHHYSILYKVQTQTVAACAYAKG